MEGISMGQSNTALSPGQEKKSFQVRFSPKKQKKFCEKQGFLYPMLCDENHEMLKAYGVWGKKKFMGREYKGISRITYIIDKKGIIAKTYKSLPSVQSIETKKNRE